MTSSYCRRVVRAVVVSLALPLLGLALVRVSLVAAQVTPDQMAELILNGARKAYNEKNYPFAVQRFQEYLAKFPAHKNAPIARYGLALALLDGPARDYPKALEQLQALAAVKDFPDQPYVFYYTGVSQRGLGINELAQIAAKPQEAPQRKAAANQRFEDASKQFAAASAAFAARVTELPKEVVVLPIDLEWSARARCDLAEMQLRVLKAKEAQATVEPFVKGTPLAKSRYRPLGLYYHGFSSFLLNDLNTAGRSLSQLAPFTDPVFGTHGRYLLARVHHLGEEQTEAREHYDSVLAEYAKQKQAAGEALKQPARFANDPEEKARLESLVKEPPDHVVRSSFYLGVLLYEAGRYADALARFAAIGQQFPGSPLLAEAQLRLGFCQVQLKEFDNAVKSLAPLAEKEPRLADQAMLWIGKAQAGSADPTKPDQQKQALTAAIDTLRKAADRAGQLAASDPEAKLRRGEILLELADTQQQAGQHKEAAVIYEQILNEKVLPQRDEEVLQRRVSALHLAGDFPGSDQAVARFQQTYPKSSLLPVVLFRHAENAYFLALAAEKNPDANVRAKEVPKLMDEAGKRYQAIIAKFPEYAHVNLARYGLGMTYYRKADFDKAREVLESIPAPERQGSLAMTPYLLADCRIRLAPLKADDALTAGRTQEHLQTAAELLEGYIGGDPKGALTPDALIKLGHCYQRLAGLLAQPPERAKVVAGARAAYERLLKDFPQHGLAPQAIFERAKTLALAGDKNGAMNELRRFNADPLRPAPIAPMALLQLANLHRELNQAEAAVKVLAEARQQFEPSLAKDPERASWSTLLAYHHGVALREFGKLPEARGVFDQVAKTGGNRPEALDALLRSGQCLQQEGLLKIDAGRKRLATPNLKAEDIAQAQKTVDDGYKAIRDAAAYFDAQVEPLKQRQAPAETRARVHYEAAWAYRHLGDPETSAARTKLQQDLLKKAQDEAVKKDPKYRPPAVVALPDLPLAQVPVQPAEQKARAHYQALVALADVPLSVDGRLELAELLVQRDDYNAAIALLNQALDKEPNPELTAKVRVRLGACLAGKKDLKAALTQFDVVAGNPKNPPALIAQAHYRAGECLIELGDNAKAAARLALFRDQPPFQNVPGTSDRALLRLGYVLGLLGQWDQSRNAYEQCLARFGGNTPWLHEARYGIGWAFQNQKQYDQAVNFYNQVVAGTAGEIAAKAQLQVGLCRLEQKRHPEAATAFLTVPFTYDYPELTAAALCEAARTFADMKQKEQAEKLLQRVIKDHAQSKWAEVARERLEALKKG